MILLQDVTKKGQIIEWKLNQYVSDTENWGKNFMERDMKELSGSVPYHDYCGGYITVHICQNSWNSTWKLVIELYLNCP
jgi:hypothetical protein